MSKCIKAYNNEHEVVIKRFEMPDKKPIPFCAEEDTLRELVQYALKKSFNDFNFRTLHKKKDPDNEKVTVLDNLYKQWVKANPSEKNPSVTMYLMKRLGKDFEDRFVSYFLGDPLSEKAFDGWHYTTCKMFMDNLEGAENYSHLPRIYENLNYGKAQKIVNMMFKHLYCFRCEEDWEARWEPYFKHCHMTLDNFTLEWFKRTVDPYQRAGSWSNLVYRKKPVDKNDYLFYQTHIRIFFEKQRESKGLYRNVTPFQAEFYIWPEIQLHLAAEAFIFELNPEAYKGKETDPTKNRADIIELSLAQLIAKVTNEISEFEKKQK